MPHDNGPAGGARITTTAGGPGSPGPGPGSHSDDASALFGLYVAQFSNYNKTYGSLARGDHLPAVALDHQPGAALRRRTERRDRTRPSTPSRHPRRGRTPSTTPRTRVIDKTAATNDRDIQQGRALRRSRGHSTTPARVDDTPE